jgi:acetoin utilization protein AcuB
MDQIRDCMSTRVISVGPDTSVPDAHYLMSRQKIRRLPVVKDGSLVGIVSLHDIYQAEASEAVPLKAWELNYVLSKVKVQAVMTVKPITVRPDSSIMEAAQLMLEHKIGGLPVVEGEQLVGMVTESDLFRHMVEHWGEITL